MRPVPTQDQIAQAYADADVTTVEDIRQGVRDAMSRVEDRIALAYQTMPLEQAHEATAWDRALLKAQCGFLKELGG